MMTLREESYEISGAIKLLTRLQHDFDMSLIPCTPMYYNGDDISKQGQKMYFPIEKKYRKLFGDAMYRWLLESKDNMRQYLYGDKKDFLAHYIKDKNGKVTKIKIE